MAQTRKPAPNKSAPTKSLPAKTAPAKPTQDNGGAERRNRPPVLFSETQKVIRAIEKHIDGTFLTYWNSPNGSVAQEDAVALYKMLQQIGKQQRVNLFIKSDGGDGRASLRMVHLLRHSIDYLVALIPLNCASAATMLALGANEILMGPLAYLSAVDTSLIHDLSPIDRDNERVSVSQNELARILHLWRQAAPPGDSNPYKSIFEYIHPLVIGAVDRASSLSIRLCSEILSYHIEDPDVAQRISQTLNSDYPSHAYPITVREAQRVGLNARELDPQLDDLLSELIDLYAEMGQRAVTDFDQEHSHDNQILAIMEAKGIQIFFQSDKDWHYRAEERRWIVRNDVSTWRKVQYQNGKTQVEQLHIR